MSHPAVAHGIRVVDYMASRPAGSSVKEAARNLRVPAARARTLLEATAELLALLPVPGEGASALLRRGARR